MSYMLRIDVQSDMLNESVQNHYLRDTHAQ